MVKKGGYNMEKVKTLIWKGEVTFEGTPEKFKAFADALQSHRVAVDTGDRFNLGVNAGYMRRFELPPIILQGLIDKSAEVAVHMPMPGMIAGGIRSPHVHIGQEAVLVPKEQFKTFLGDVVKQMAENRVDMETDFYDMIRPFAMEEF